MSVSGTAKAVKEFIFQENTYRDQSTNRQGRQFVKSEKYNKKIRNNKNKATSQNGLACVKRAQTRFEPICPIYLNQIDTIIKAPDTLDDLTTYPYNFQQDGQFLQWLVMMAEQSPLCHALLQSAKSDGWMVVLDDAEQEFHIDHDIQLITIDHFGFTANAIGRSAHYRNLLLTSFIKALRQISHDNKNYLYQKSHRPDSILLIERAIEADLQTIVVMAAWELRAAGLGECWRHVPGSDYGDMAMIFTRAIEKDPSGIYDGSVLTRTFCQWYGDFDRVSIQDHKVLEYMDTRLKDNEMFGFVTAKAQDIEKLSCLPDGQIYLKGMGQNICNDPYFLSMNDPINESHLFQIIYDSKVFMAEGVPFRDQKLARLIFPTKKTKVSPLNS